MAWLTFNFACPCGCVYTDLVQGVDGSPDPCPECGSFVAKKTMSAPKLAKTIIPMYPGSKNHTAEGGAAFRRPAEKAGRQVSMYAGRK
jgi:hypothetical protein